MSVNGGAKLGHLVSDFLVGFLILFQREKILLLLAVGYVVNA